MGGQGVGVGRHRVAEDGQAGVAVAGLDVPENLIVGAVLADDIEDVLDLAQRYACSGPRIAPSGGARPGVLA